MKRVLYGMIFIFVFLLTVRDYMPFDESKAQNVITFFEALVPPSGRHKDKPFTLLKWQRDTLWDVYGTVDEDGFRQYQYVWIELPKKNGKSTLASGIALYHLHADGEPSAEVYGCAGDKDQAKIVFKGAKVMTQKCKALSRRSRIVASENTIYAGDSYYMALSSDVPTKHGLNPSAIIFDEIHTQPDRHLWDVMTFGSGSARDQPIVWVITTAGDDPDRNSIAWELHDYAMRVASGDIIDPTWYVVIFAYDGDDIYNEENWYKANPSLGHTIKIDAIRKLAHKAQQNAANEKLFRWLVLNQWVSTKLTGWLPLELFDNTVGDWDMESLLGKECYIGLDLSSTTDLTAISAIFPPQGAQLDWRVIWLGFIPEENMRERIEKDHVPYDQWVEKGYIIATPGTVVDYTIVKQTILLWCALYKVKEIDADRAFAAMLLQELEKDYQLVCVHVPQTMVGLTNAMNQIEVELKAGTMTHQDNLTARWCFGNTSIAVNGSGLKKYVKETKGRGTITTKRIDFTAAMVIAEARAIFYEGTVDLDELIRTGQWGM